MTKATQHLHLDKHLSRKLGGQDMIRVPFWIKFIFLLVVSSCFLGTSMAEPDTSREYKIKAAFLYNFAKFIEWPDDESDQVLQFCMAGTGKMNAAMKAIVGKKIRGRVIQVRQLDKYNEAPGCNLVFVARSNGTPSKAILSSMTEQGIVTIGDGDKFVHYGGMISFTTKKAKKGSDATKNRVGFAVNMDAARKAGVQISSELLKLATVVQGEL